ncbi:hypothetical protein BS47DRAFT_1402164 [Hydnum rufescens UP504]|uniref:Uncharacterized protein n=1 Tax=Hydnum rufescens UP504 TaxID=1448309 RepID=A0A9P6AEG3_9AGAM|nr:hypothetical protein BS47DRAFT_1402164 [Hydnum rufescens UP504]
MAIYEDKRNEDVKQHADLLDQLSRTVANHNMQIDSLMPPLALLSSTLHQREADLETRSKILDNRDTKLAHDEECVANWRDRLLYPSAYHHVSQTDRLSRIFIQAADIIRQHHRLDTPSSAFALHRCIAPAISQLASSLRETDESFLTIVPNDRAVLYYTRHVRDIQYDLRDNEWAEFKKNPATPYELADLPSNPATEDSDQNSRILHQTQKAPTSTKLASHILYFRASYLAPHTSHLVPLLLASHILYFRASYLAPHISRLIPRVSYPRASYLAPRTLAPRISHLVSRTSYSRASYLAPHTLMPHTSRLVPLGRTSSIMPTNILTNGFPEIHTEPIPDLDDIQIPDEIDWHFVQFTQHVRDRDDPILKINIGRMGYFCPSTTNAVQTYMLARIESYCIIRDHSEGDDFHVKVQIRLIVFGNVDRDAVNLPTFVHLPPV